MEFHLKTAINNFDFNLNFESNIVLMGSCFSDEMDRFFRNGGLTTLSNPFGTLFHPLAIANCIESSINEDESVEVYQRDDLFFTWEASGVVYAETETELREQVLSRRKALRNALKSNSLLLVTFGTSWGYRLKESNRIVGNCHKKSQDSFQRELSTTDEMIKHWRSLYDALKKFNPKLKLVFTVSPVRHKKDGLIENNRSKARLIELVHSLVSEDIFYFPAYEIVLDELRDYRFYTKDLVHPNEIAVEYVWERLSHAIFSEKQLLVMKKVANLKTTMAHKSLFPNSKEDKARVEKANELRTQLSYEYPLIQW